MPSAMPFRMPLALRRALYLGPSLLLVVIVGLLTERATGGLDTWPQQLLLILLLINALPLALACWQAVIGFALHCMSVRAGTSPEHEPPSVAGGGRTAIVVPIYDEDVPAVRARVEVTAGALARSSGHDGIEIFILSDTQDPKIAAAERAAFLPLPAMFPGLPVHYRRRRRNLGRKAGNIADFCARHGDRFEFMIVLDADSLMAAPTVRLLIQLMQAHPRVGLIQTVTYQANLDTLFARVKQFSAHLYVPLSMRGLDFWQAGHGNYWGHNAILRMQAFRDHCRLPVLQGRPPLGGEILCHDVVEAALLHRAGWEVRLLPLTGGSWEEMPANLIDFAGRNRRWCQGNLQHLRLLVMPGLPWPSRLHLGLGIALYVTAPIWLVVLGLTLALHMDAAGADAGSTAAGIGLVALVLGMVTLPKLLGLVVALACERRRRLFGGGRRLALSMPLELLLSGMLWPSTLLFHTRFVLMTLAGRVVPWEAQPRGQQEVPLRCALRRQTGHVLLGVAAAALGLVVDPVVTAWASPLLLGLIAAPFLTAWSSRVGAGRAARRLGLFVTPDEVEPAAELRRLAALEGAAAPGHAAHRITPPDAIRFDLPAARGMVAANDLDRRATSRGIDA